jgi:hypothetical protein
VFDVLSTRRYRDYIMDARTTGAVEVDDADHVKRDMCLRAAASDYSYENACPANSTTFTTARCADCGGVVVV